MASDAQTALTEALRDALAHCDTSGGNLPEILRASLETLAGELGGTDALVRHRPGSWEAEHIRRLAALADLDTR